MEYEGEIVVSPCQTIKMAFKYNLLDNGELWLQMLEKRNVMAYTYNEEYFKNIFESIVNQYFEQIHQLYNQLKILSNE